MPSREWFREWFGEEYLAVYPHRDESEAEAAVRLFLSAVPPVEERPVLDLACGAGRHLLSLRRSGRDAIGLDLSRILLKRAAAASRSPLVCGDMRELPFGRSVFGGVTSFFTSFGYFPTREEDAHTLREMRRVLAPGGSFMLDFLNAARVRRELVSEDIRVLGSRRVRQQRAIEGDAVVKRIRIERMDRAGMESTFEERVRLYELPELKSLLRSCRLEPAHLFGDYDEGAFSAASPRLILAGRAE